MPNAYKRCDRKRLRAIFVDFEFILIDDGSTDHTSSIIQSYNDKRVRLIQNSHNFIESLNLE